VGGVSEAQKRALIHYYETVIPEYTSAGAEEPAWLSLKDSHKSWSQDWSDGLPFEHPFEEAFKLLGLPYEQESLAETEACYRLAGSLLREAWGIHD